jgi:hypothetical protein
MLRVFIVRKLLSLSVKPGKGHAQRVNQRTPKQFFEKRHFADDKVGGRHGVSNSLLMDEKLMTRFLATLGMDR